MSRPARSPAARSTHPRSSPGRWRALAAVVMTAVALTGCKVDTEVAVEVDRTGAGSIAVTVQADAEIVRAQPDLVDDFRGDDLVAAGWTIDGPSATDDGGARLVLRSTFDSVEQANRLLVQLSGAGGPFQNLALVQDRSTTRVATEMSGAILVDGTAAFADNAVIATLSSAPYEELMRQRGLGLDQVLGLRFSLTVPGEIVETDGTADPAEVGAGTTRVRWAAALSGAAVAPPGQPLTLRAAFDDDDARQARRVRDFAVWALPAWLVFFCFVVVPVVYLRRRRMRGLPPPRRPSHSG